MAQISFLHLISQTYFIFHQVETKQVETRRGFENVKYLRFISPLSHLV